VSSESKSAVVLAADVSFRSFHWSAACPFDDLGDPLLQASAGLT
jgi:hypothetical protein